MDKFILDRCIKTSVICYLLILVAITLFPYDFFFREISGRLDQQFLIYRQETPVNLTDILINVLLFLPLGFWITYITQKRILSRLTVLPVILVISLGLSFVIELLQVFVASRNSSLIDVVSNVVGGLIGFLCFILCGNKVRDCALAFVKKGEKLLSIKNLLLSFLGYATLAFLISIPLQWSTRLSNWDKAFHLVLGNERTGEYPWKGRIYEVYIADKAFSEKEVVYTFSGKESFASIRNSLLASYQLTSINGYHDKMGNLPDLVWRGEPQDDQQDKGVFLDANYWLETAAPASYLTQRIIETSQFTLGVRLATANTMQTGPARIVSLSGGSSHRNFTLGQEGNDLAFRLRTPSTGEDGKKPQLLVPNVFSTTKLHNVLITYDGSVLLVYVDGVRNSHALEFNPGATLFGFLSSPDEVGIMLYKNLYYALIFIPLGILLSLAVKIMRRRLVIKILIICGGILLPSFILEGILVGVSDRVVILDNLLICTMFTASPIMVFKFLAPYLLVK